MNKAQVLGLIRTVLIAVGGYAVGKGIFDSATVNDIAGSVVVIIGAVWSVLSPEKKAT